MKIDIITLFPELFANFLETSLVLKARQKKLFSASVVQLRDFADLPHRQVDDTPYGGGPGMVMKPEPIFKAISASKSNLPNAKVIFPTPSGRPFSNEFAREISKERELIFLCGRYEGVDQRVIDNLVDYEITIGDYILMGGELPTMVIIESILRFIPGVLGNANSLDQESFQSIDNEILLEAPQYTKPQSLQGMEVPEILLSGDHKRIANWRLKQSKIRTKKFRSDLFK